MSSSEEWFVFTKDRGGTATIFYGQREECERRAALAKNQVNGNGSQRYEEVELGRRSPLSE